MPEKGNEDDKRIEGQYTRLILKRTMTLFFLVVFSIPFFEYTTYRSFGTGYQQLVHMMEYVRDNSADPNDYSIICNKFVETNKDLFWDNVAFFKTPEGTVYYESPQYLSGELRIIEK